MMKSLFDLALPLVGKHFISFISPIIVWIYLVPNAGAQILSSEHKIRSDKTAQVQIAAHQAYLDLEAIVTSQERSQWVIDQHALSTMSPQIMEVICQLPPLFREALHNHLIKRNIQNGHAKDFWQKSPKNDAGLMKTYKTQKEFEKQRHQERILLSFSYAQEHLGQCPYWLPKTSTFMGIHRDAGRLQFLIETMGGLQLQTSEAGLFIGGAAQGRLIIVYGFGASWGLGIGLEAGGASTFPKNDQGQRSVRAEWAGGLPILLRTWIHNYRLDAELTPVVRFNDHNLTEQIYGGRAAVGFGFSPLRILGALPHIMAWVGGEKFFDQKSTIIYRAGTRIGFSF